MLRTRPDPGSRLLQIVLVGQPELKAKLDSAGLKDLRKSIAVQCNIRPLTLKESKAYIDHRLRIVGSATSRVLKPEVVDRICAFARGIPRVINMVCDAALLIGYSKSRHEIDVKIVKEAVQDLSAFEPAQSAEPVSEPIQAEELTPVNARTRACQGSRRALSEPAPPVRFPEPAQSRKPRRVRPAYLIVAGSMLATLVLGVLALWTWDRAPSRETRSETKGESADGTPQSCSHPESERGGEGQSNHRRRKRFNPGPPGKTALWHGKSDRRGPYPGSKP